MRKTFIFPFCLAVILFFMPAYGHAQEPEEFVREFYHWYGTFYLTQRDSPSSSEIMFRYVYPCTVEKNRLDQKRGAIDYDYFLGSQDFWQELLDNFRTFGHIVLNDRTYIVPISSSELPRQLVFVKKDKGRLFITKVVDTLGH